jgi:hypothetical protein
MTYYEICENEIWADQGEDLVNCPVSACAGMCEATTCGTGRVPADTGTCATAEDICCVSDIEEEKRFWGDSNKVEISNAKVGDTVHLYWESNTFVEGATSNIKFKIYENDALLNDDIALLSTSIIDNYATTSHEITIANWEEGQEPGEGNNENFIFYPIIGGKENKGFKSNGLLVTWDQTKCGETRNTCDGVVATETDGEQGDYWTWRCGASFCGIKKDEPCTQNCGGDPTCDETWVPGEECDGGTNCQTDCSCPSSHPTADGNGGCVEELREGYCSWRGVPDGNCEGNDETKTINFNTIVSDDAPAEFTCTDKDSKTYTCPVLLPFFNLFNIIIALVIISGIYFVIEKKE